MLRMSEKTMKTFAEILIFLETFFKMQKTENTHFSREFKGKHKNYSQLFNS